jgi:hypothetical protein
LALPSAVATLNPHALSSSTRMRRMAASLAVSVTLWELEGAVTASDKRLCEAPSRLRCAAFRLANQCAVLISAANRPACPPACIRTIPQPAIQSSCQSYPGRQPARHAVAKTVRSSAFGMRQDASGIALPRCLRKVLSPADFQHACPRLETVE